MTTKISGNELRDRLLARMRRPVPEPTEQTRIEALASAGNRELLGIIATKQPRSINELTALSGRLQPNVSRSLNVLARAGLLTVTLDGRASVPTLTPEGKRKAEDLGFVEAPTPSEIRFGPAIEGPVLSTTIVGPRGADLDTDLVEGEVTVRFPGNGHEPIAAYAKLNLSEVCINLLASWWRLLYRRADPFKMFPLERKIGDDVSSRAMLLARSTGRGINLLARSLAEDEDYWDFAPLALEEAKFSALVLDGLVRPTVQHLHAGRRFDRPVESMLRRIEDIQHYPTELCFWRTAGALGLSHTDIETPVAENVTRLVETIADEDARLDFASATNPALFDAALTWVSAELSSKAKTNCLPRLVEMREDKGANGALRVPPWRIGTARARRAREQLGIGADCSIGSVGGLTRIFGSDGVFMPSPAGEDPIRGFEGYGDSTPVVVVKNERPRSTAFLIARAVGDYLVFGSREAPIADLYTDRQAVGRAFAAEFLAPAQGVIHMVEDERKPMVTVAEHYGVSLQVIGQQYRNNVPQFEQA